MLSKFELDVDMTKEYNARVLKDTTLTGTKNATVKLYIPNLMSNIKKGNTPTTSIVKTKGSGVFKNANRKPVLTGLTLREQNFMTANINLDTTSEDIDSTVELITTYIKSSIDSDVQNISSKNIKYILKKGSKVRTCCLNGKVSKLSYTLTNESETVKELK